MSDLEKFELKKVVLDAINKRYGSLSDFIGAGVPEKLGINVKTLPVYLSSSKHSSISFAVMAKLCDYLDLGTLTRRTIIEKKTVYSFSTKVRKRRRKRT